MYLQVTFTYNGTLADINVVENLAAEAPTLQEVEASKDFWYNDLRIAANPSEELLPNLEAWADSLGTKRGELKLPGKGTRVRAFVAKDDMFS